MLNFTENESKVWGYFSKYFNLSQDKLEQFIKYYSLLIQENKNISLTTITDLKDVIDYHFIDSLMISKFHDMSKVKCICDVGAGAGFPGIPLKILYPESSLILIEVVQKKIKFLEKVIEALELENVFVCDLDWRTFLRQEGGIQDSSVSSSKKLLPKNGELPEAGEIEINLQQDSSDQGVSETIDFPEIDFFCARASLQPEDLVRVFSSSCRFNKATFVYWAANNWKPEKKVQNFVKKQKSYRVGDRDRKFVFMNNSDF